MGVPLFKKKHRKRDLSASVEVVHPAQFQGDDETLIRNIIAGRSLAFRTFYHRHFSRVYSVLLRTLGDDSDLDILVQEVFTKAFRNIGTLKNASQVKAWLASIAVHTARDTIKHRKRSRRFLLFEPARLPEPSTAADIGLDRETVSAVYRLLDNLGVDARIAFTLRYMHEMELVEVAEACNVSLATVKRRLAKAKRQFCAAAESDPALSEWVGRQESRSSRGVKDD